MRRQYFRHIFRQRSPTSQGCSGKSGQHPEGRKITTYRETSLSVQVFRFSTTLSSATKQNTHVRIYIPHNGIYIPDALELPSPSVDKRKKPHRLLPSWPAQPWRRKHLLQRACQLEPGGSACVSLPVVWAVPLLLLEKKTREKPRHSPVLCDPLRDLLDEQDALPRHLQPISDGLPQRTLLLRRRGRRARSSPIGGRGALSPCFPAQAADDHLGVLRCLGLGEEGLHGGRFRAGQDESGQRVRVGGAAGRSREGGERESGRKRESGDELFFVRVNAKEGGRERTSAILPMRQESEYDAVASPGCLSSSSPRYSFRYSFRHPLFPLPFDSPEVRFLVILLAAVAAIPLLVAPVHASPSGTGNIDVNKPLSPAFLGVLELVHREGIQKLLRDEDGRFSFRNLVFCLSKVIACGGGGGCVSVGCVASRWRSCVRNRVKTREGNRGSELEATLRNIKKGQGGRNNAESRELFATPSPRPQQYHVYLVLASIQFR